MEELSNAGEDALLEPQICPKMLKTLSEKLGAKFPATTPAPWLNLATSMTLPEIFFNPKQAREMANHSSKKKNRG